MTCEDASSSAGVFDAQTVLLGLARTRPVFHSEDDFKFAFAWEAKRLWPELAVRLETHPEPHVRRDLELIEEASGHGVAVELKYMTRLWAGSVDSESYALKNHGALDLRGYDVVKDLERVGRFVAGRPAWSGLVIVVTNDPGYWRRAAHGRPTNADAFRLYEGYELSGQRSWGPSTGGTAKGREASLNLRGRYELHWTDYSRLDATSAGTFRSLVVPVQVGP